MWTRTVCRKAMKMAILVLFFLPMFVIFVAAETYMVLMFPWMILSGISNSAQVDHVFLWIWGVLIALTCVVGVGVALGPLRDETLKTFRSFIHS